MEIKENPRYGQGLEEAKWPHKGPRRPEQTHWESQLGKYLSGKAYD